MPVTEYKRTLQAGMGQQAAATNIAPVRKVLDDFAATQMERSIQAAETEAGRMGAQSGDIASLMDPSTRAGRSFNKAAVMAHAPKLEFEARQISQDVLKAWQQGKFQEDVAKVQTALRKSKQQMLANVDPDARMVYGPRLDELFNETVLKVDADRAATVLTREREYVGSALDSIEEDVYRLAKEGDPRAVEDSTIFTEMINDSVERGLMDHETAAGRVSTYYDNFNKYSLIGEWTDPITGKIQVNEAVHALQNPPAGVSLEVLKSAYTEAMYEAGQVSGRETAAAAAEAKAQTANEKQWEADGSAYIFSGQMMEPEGMDSDAIIDNFWQNNGYYPPRERQNAIRADEASFLANYGKVTDNKEMVTKLEMDLYTGVASGRDVDAAYRTSLSSNKKVGIGDESYSRLRSLAGSLEAKRQTLADQGKGDDFSRARQELMIAMGIVETIPGIVSKFIGKPEDGPKRLASLQEFHSMVERGEDPYVASTKVVAGRDWVNYQEETQNILQNDILRWPPENALMSASEWDGKFKQLREKFDEGEMTRREYQRTVIIWNDIKSTPTDIQ